MQYGPGDDWVGCCLASLATGFKLQAHAAMSKGCLAPYKWICPIMYPIKHGLAMDVLIYITEVVVP